MNVELVLDPFLEAWLFLLILAVLGRRRLLILPELFLLLMPDTIRMSFTLHSFLLHKAYKGMFDSASMINRRGCVGLETQGMV